MDYNKVLKAYFGYDTLKPEQMNIIDSILSGQDTIGLLPTGFGKSITFQLPAILLDGVTLVITPLIALMEDQVKNLKKKEISAERIHSLLSKEEQDKVYKNLQEGKIKLLYLSGERLQNPRFLKEIQKIPISLFVIDEAHTIVWSEDFRIALGHIPEFFSFIGYRPCHLALTATATQSIVTKVIRYLNLSEPKIISASFDRETIFYKMVRTSEKERELLSFLVEHQNELGIIYCLTIRTTKKVYQMLSRMGFQVGLYHGELEASEKKKMQNAFTTKEIKIMVCTNSFGMGIDLDFIRYVVEYEMPMSIEDFSQQTGRAGRDGKPATALLLFDMRDISTANYFIEHLRNKEKTEKELSKIKIEREERLDKMIQFCLTRKCLHAYISTYFGQPHAKNCKYCSNCLKE